MLKKFRKGVKFTAMALTFGVVASAAFQGTNFLFNQIDGGAQEEQEARLSMADAVNTSSDASASTEEGAAGSSSVAAIADAAMPSLVAITNQSVQEMMNWL